LLAEDGGRGGGGCGEVDLGNGGAFAEVAEVGKRDDIGGRALRREEDVGMVSRRAVGLDEGVDGLVGGTL